MKEDEFAEKMFEMKLLEIYENHPWLAETIPVLAFMQLFPVYYKNGKPLELIKPEFDLDRDIFLEVLVAFKQSFG